VSLGLVGIYCLCVFGGRRFIKSRPAFSLEQPLVLWSLFLAVYSIVGAIRTTPEMIAILSKHGLHASLCHPCYLYGVTGFWSSLFTISKVVELGDTAFIVLRKKPLIFLHWYHHASVLVYVWYSNVDQSAPGRWFYSMNYIVHAFMYTYYTLRAMRVSMPRMVAMGITTMQITQMLIGNAIFVYLFYDRFLGEGKYCHTSISNMVWGCAMYFSYLVLFVQYFMKAYGFVQRTGSATQSFEMQHSNGRDNGKERCNGSHNGHGNGNGNGSSWNEEERDFGKNHHGDEKLE